MNCTLCILLAVAVAALAAIIAYHIVCYLLERFFGININDDRYDDYEPPYQT